MDEPGMEILIFFVVLHTGMSFGNIPEEIIHSSDCSRQAAGLPCVAYKMEVADCASAAAKFPDLYASSWAVDRPSQILAEHFCKRDKNDNNLSGLRIRWKLPTHSGMRDLKGFEIMISGAVDICIVEDLSKANITRDLFEYGVPEFEQTVYPIKDGSLYLVTIHSLPKKKAAHSQTHFSSSTPCEGASAANWVANIKIKKDFMNGTIFVTFDPPPAIYEFKEFTYKLRRIGKNSRFEERRLNSYYCSFGNLTFTEEYEVEVQPYDPFWNDNRCKCKNIAKLCDTCTWTRTGIFTFDNPRVRRNNVTELVIESTTARRDLERDTIILLSVISIIVLIVIIVFIIWRKGGLRKTSSFVPSEQDSMPLDLKRQSGKGSDTKKGICLVVSGEMEEYSCLLSPLQNLIQSTGRCITWVLDSSFSSRQKMVEVRKPDIIVLVTIPVYTKPVTDEEGNYSHNGNDFLGCMQNTNAKSAKGETFREKVIHITIHDVAPERTQFPGVRQFQLPNDLVPFLVDIGCFQAALTNDFVFQRQCLNRDVRTAFDNLVATCQTLIDKNRVENQNIPSGERCQCKMRSKDYHGKIESEIRASSCSCAKDGTKPDDVGDINTQGINQVGKDLSKNVSFSGYQSQNRVQPFEDLKNTRSSDGSCIGPTHEQMLKSSLPFSYRNDTRVIRKKYIHDSSFEDVGFSVVHHEGELKQKQPSSFDCKLMETFLDQNKLKITWDCQYGEEGGVYDESNVPDSGFFECMSLAGVQFLGASDIDETDQEDIISRDMYLINRRYDDVIKQLNKGETVSISGNSV